MNDINLRHIGKYISMIYRASLIHINENLKKFNLTSSEYLFIINIPEDKEVNLTYLTKKLYVDPALTTNVINNLAKKRFIKKTKCENDKRSFVIRLTEDGLKMKPIILNILKNWVDQITVGMSIDEKKSTLKSLEFIVKNIYKDE